jgi:ABC-type transporter Mla maintaining outer membrane lipid asymmetry ATPase subunit MlaF
MYPEVMMYDEPTTDLDPIMGDIINELSNRARRCRPGTSVVVTHDMRAVRKVAGRVVMVHLLERLAPGDAQIIFDRPPMRNARLARREAHSRASPRLAQSLVGNALWTNV